jgi:hypothetical protein
VAVVGLPEDPAAEVEEPRVGDYSNFLGRTATYSLSCGFPQYNPAVATAWPLVGRHDELAAMCAAIAESGGVVLTGVPVGMEWEGSADRDLDPRDQGRSR